VDDLAGVKVGEGHDLAEMAALMPGGQLITIPAGHLVHATQSTRFIAAVTAFLSASALPA
jgi:pimeloyl-ACP methyl ester carboxylesterase